MRTGDCGRAVAALDNGRALNLSEQLEARTIAARLRAAVTATLPNDTSGPAAASPNWLTGREKYDPRAVFSHPPSNSYRGRSEMNNRWSRWPARTPGVADRMLADITRRRERYLESSDVRDLDDLTATYRRLLDHPAITAEPLLRAALSADASRFFLDSYHAHGAETDLETAVDVAQRAAADSAADPELRMLCVGILGTTLRARFDRSGDPEDIDQSITCHEHALQAAGPSSPETPGHLTNLADALWSRYLHFGSWPDLSRAAQLHREAAQAFGDDSSGRATALQNYALVLRDMYEHTSDLAYLEEATTAVVCAATDPQLNPRVRVPAMNTLALVAFARQLRTRDPSDLDLIIELITPLLRVVSGPDRAICLQNLANALGERYQLTGDMDDLSRAVAAHEEGVRLTPFDHPARPAHLDNWASTLLSRWKATGNRDDLGQVIAIREALADSVPAHEPGRVKFLNNLGLALIAAEADDPDPRTAERITAVFRDACRTGLETSPGEVLGAAGTWGGWAAGRSSWAEAVAAYEYGIAAIRSVFQTQLLRRHKEVWLVTAGRFAAEAGYAHVQNGEPQLAVQNLERGRSMMLSEALERSRADLDDLDARGYSDLRTRFARAVQIPSRP